MQKQIQIALVEDHLSYRQGLISMLKEYDEIKVLFHVSNGKEALDQLKLTKPDIILMDIEMPIMSGNVFYDKLKIKYPLIKVIIISQHFKEPYILEFIKKEVNAFLDKNTDIEKIVDAIYTVYENGFYSDSKVAKAMANLIKTVVPQENIKDFHNVTLTSRELEILKLICAGNSNRAISEKVHLSVRTVEGHRLSILHKTECKSVLDLINYSNKNNIIIPK
jgi:DNA-binding NarL/FixJ family response regulator